MDISEIASVWSPDIAQGAHSGSAPTEADMGKVTREFEAMLLRQFLGQALKPLLHEAPGSNAPGADIYQHMLTDAIAGQLASEEIFGMSTLLQMQLAGAVPKDGAAEAAANTPVHE